jgi:hypothetical protein
LNKTPAPFPSDRRPWLPRLAECVAWLLLTVTFLVAPREAMSWSLDSSNYGSYAWMFAAGRQFGADTVAMTGPFGFLAYGHTYSGYLFHAYFVGDLLFKATFALLVLRVFAQGRSQAWKWIWIAALVVFLPSVDDLLYDVAILVAAVALLGADERRRFLDATSGLAAALLGFSVLMKGSHATLAAATLAAVSIHGLLNRRLLRAGIIAGAAGGTFLVGWMAAHQRLSHLPGYFRGLYALTGGYNQTMGLAPEPRMFAAGLALAIGLATTLLLSAIASPRNRQNWLLLLFFAGFSLLKWKHGFVRADGHVYMFFGFVTIAVPLLELSLAPAEASAPRRRRALHNIASAAAALVLVLAGAATSSFSFPRFGELLTDAPRRTIRLLKYVCAPDAIREPRERELAQNRLRGDLPLVRQRVAQRPIDFFGYEEGLLLLNGLNYRPRPMGGGAFNVYHPYLQKLNDGFVRNPAKRPDFFLLKLQTIDGRLPTADDPLTLETLLYGYRPVLAEKDTLLFERREAPLPAVQRIAEPAAHLGEWIAVPARAPDQLTLFSLEAPRSTAGIVRAMLYRPTDLFLDVETAAGAVLTFRLPPLTTHVPILLSPLLTQTADLPSLYDEKIAGQEVSRIRLRAPDGGFAGAVAVSFFSASRPAADLAAAEEFSAYFRQPLSNRPSNELVTQPTGITELFGEPITLVHAPGKLSFPIKSGDRGLVFDFGLMPQAYDPGETDGVEFIVEYVSSGGTAQTLFSRLLQPRTVTEDRGMQEARIALPAPTDSGVVRIRTERGPAGNGAWDQSYVTHVRILQHNPASGQ